MKKIKYVLSNIAKYHHFEVAKALFKKDQLTKIVCGYPWFKLKKEKIPKKYVDCFGLYNIINYFLRDSKYESIAYLEDRLQYINANAISKRSSKYIEEADVLLAMSGTGLFSGRKTIDKNKIYVCDRGAVHLLYQKEIFIEEYKSLNLNAELLTILKRGFNNWKVERETKEYELANYILVPSQFAKKSFEKYGITKTVVAEYGIDLSNFHPIKDIKKDPKYFDIIFIGQVSTQKGLHYLIEAFNKFKNPNKRLHIFGQHTLDKEFFINKLNNDKIYYHGKVDHRQLKYFINKSDVFVLASLQEGYATVVSQAMACGCPVIVSENTGLAEYVRKYQCGFVVPIRDSNAILEKLELLSDDNNLKIELKNNAINASIKNTWDDYVDKLNNIFSRLV